MGAPVSGISTGSDGIKWLGGFEDYEDAELTAARIAASLGMYSIKGDSQSWSHNDSK